MSSKVNNALFDLVNSMTKSEKRYFKLISSRHTIGEENNYIRIFDYLDKKSKYDETQLFQYFKGEVFLNRFSITKKRLYDHILTALDAFYCSNSEEAQLHKMLHSADILFEKSLYGQCRRLLRSAKKMAQKHQFVLLHLEVIEKQKKLLETTGYSLVDQSEIEEIENNEAVCMGALICNNLLWMVKSELFIRLSRKGVARSNEEVESYREICKPVLDLKEQSNLNVDTNYLLNHTLSAYYYAIGDLESSLLYLKSNLALFGATSKELAIEDNKQVSVLTNAIYIADKIGAHNEAITYINQLKKLSASTQDNKDMSIKLFSSISSIELSMKLRMGDFVNANAIAEEIEEKLNLYGDKIIPLRRVFLEFKLAVYHIGTNNFSEALRWVNNILNDSTLDKTEDIMGFTQLLDLLIHLELDNNQLLPYSLKSTQRFFKTRNRMYSFEKVLLQSIAKMIKCEDQFGTVELWEELYEELTKITSDDTFESVALDYFDFQSWAYAKLKSKSFDSIVKEKYNKSIRVAS